MNIFEQIIKLSVRHRWLTLLITLFIAALGAYNYSRLPIDAVPDITNVQVQVNTEAHGYTPIEVEQRITFPLETAIAGLPRLDYTRSISRYGLSQITVVFEDNTDIYFARQLINERLQEAAPRLPPQITPSLGPITTGLGEIFIYIVQNAEGSDRHSPLELRTIQDWIVKPQVRTLPGVAEVNSLGGYEKQFHVTPWPERLKAFDLTFDDIVEALLASNANIGAGYIERNGEQYLVRSPGQFESIEDLTQVVVSTHHNVPVYLTDVAHVYIGNELRTGAATKDGKEVVMGTVFMLMGENSRVVSALAGDRITEINRSLPKGAVAVPVYDRTNLVNATIKTVKENLFEGAILVITVLFLFLGNFKAALITALVIPLSMLFAVTGMVQSKITGNLMSLGAIDFGLIVDGAVIIVENCIRRLGEEQRKLGRLLTSSERFRVVFDASKEVRQATMFGELIIMIVYLPILALGGIEGKLFHPMAYTVILALLGAMIFSVTFVPAAVALFVKGKVAEKEGRILSRLIESYQKLLSKALIFPKRVVAGAVSVVIATAALATALGSEFVPSLDEGDIAMHALRIPGTSLSQAIEMQHILEEKIKQLPEVHTTFSKIGTAEIANDPMPPSVADGFVMLKPRTQWRNPGKAKEDVVEELETLAQSVPGNNYEFTQPIEMRFNELIAGVRSDVAVKVYGDNLDTLLELASSMAEVLEKVPGSADVKVEQITGLPFLNIIPDKQKLARYGITTTRLQDSVAIAVRGKPAGVVFEGDRRFPIVVRLPEVLREDIESLKQLPLQVPAPREDLSTSKHAQLQRTSTFSENGRYFIPLSEVARVELTEGPNQISRENGKRRIVVTANVRGRSLGEFVDDARRKIEQSVPIPPGYWSAWGGQFEHLISARERLKLVIPLALGLILTLLYMTFGTLRESLLVFTGVPLALSGGVLALWIRGIPFSISAAIGFIALSGVAVLNGLVMVTFIKRLINDGVDADKAVLQGSVTRLRPVLMTALVASFGFLPMAISTGTGSEVQRPLATVVIGGLLTSTILTLFVLPVLYKIFGGKKSQANE